MICGGLAVAVDSAAAVEPAATIEAELSQVVAAPAATDVVVCVSGVCAANCHFELPPKLAPPAVSLTR